jgi:nucleotide-binding universal stress UspA family protein
VLGVIAVAIDGSEPAAVALAMAVDLAKRYQSELVVLAVAPLPPVLVTPTEPFAPPILPQSALPQFRSIVDSAVREAKDAGVAAVTGVCYDGVVVDEILAHLASHPADLLVVGSRGLSTAKRLLLGSTSESLVTHAPCPVLVVRPPTKKPPAASA